VLAFNVTAKMYIADNGNYAVVKADTWRHPKLNVRSVHLVVGGFQWL
jgi:hypothetical protein